MTRKAVISLASLPVLVMLARPAIAQDVPQPATAEAAGPVDFAADKIDYDNNADVVTASGDVRMTRNSDRVRADRIVWNRSTGEVRAEGNVAVINAGGDTAYGDSVELTDTLRDGVVDNLLLVLVDGGRLAAESGKRVDDVTTLENAAYSPCPVVDSKGCPRRPSWQINAVRIVHDPKAKRLTFRNAQLQLFTIPLFTIPKLVVPFGGEGSTGILAPDLRYTRANGLEAAVPFYYRIGTNRDLTLTPHVYSAVLPAIEGQYRALTQDGAYQVSGFATYSSRIPLASSSSARQRDFRAYIDASGRFQLDPEWSVSGSIRRVTDRTFLRRYDISDDDRLRSVVRLERADPDSYFSLTGWSFQTLRAGERQGLSGIALPEIDYRRRFADPLVGGRVEVQLNSLAIGRSDGQDSQRAFAGVRWDLRRLTNWGQELLLTGYARGDVYHSDENAATTTALYRGRSGYHGRGIAAVALEARWPLVGSLFAGTQRLTPRLQLVASPSTPNLSIPNEDARSVDLEDSNLFALNRFPGYDRWEDGPRVTFGVDWAYDAPGLAVTANVGQSYRLDARLSLFPDGTGLTNRTSDIVGRTTVRFRRFVALTHRYRLDKDTLGIRRNEIDATIGTDKTYVLAGYLRLNRNIGPQLEDLRDREEVRLGGRVQVSRFISIFGSTTIDLTNAAEDPVSTSDGYEPVRHRLGIAYTDDCLDLGLTWRRDYQTNGDARRGNSFLLRLAFRGLGR